MFTDLNPNPRVATFLHPPLSACCLSTTIAKSFNVVFIWFFEKISTYVDNIDKTSESGAALRYDFTQLASETSDGVFLIRP